MHRRDFISGALASAAAGLCLPARAADSVRARTVLVVGDSLSAEYGIARGSGWVALLEQRLAKEKKPWKVVNASISGDTTAGGRSRIGSLLAQHRPAVVVIELGGNDALRGLPLQSTADNLRNMVQAAKQAGARVLLLGMQIPPNYGQDYARKFAEVFVEISREQQTALLPFLLKGIADQADATSLFQADRIHPRAEAHPRILNNVWPALEPLLR
ncbi:MAG: arylesterase [Burkholderiaceae bacterium]|jgi:acyl-CoA thioesterase-1|nr:arylesterase [Burkholderiaceae bacterium]MCO5104315.1 arylesterase [Burkholderiaceae bacterium]